MAMFKKYSGIKACEDLVQRCILSSGGYPTVHQYKDVNEIERDNLQFSSSSSHLTNSSNNIHYLNCNEVKASVDDYDADDYNGTSTGSCIFSINVSQSGVSYTITFTANASATVKCFKFFKTLYTSQSGSVVAPSVLMFAIYLDTPMTVQAGDVKVMSVTFAYDDVEVEII